MATAVSILARDPSRFTGLADVSRGAEILDLDRDYSVETKPYILSNECNREQTAKHLAATRASEGAFHIGFSCWENFDFIVLRDSSGALIADISNQAHAFHQETRKIILASENRIEFVKNIHSYLERNPSILREELALSLSEIEAELSRPGSWLSTDAGFEKIKALYAKDQIIHIRMSILDRDAFQKIYMWMKAQGLHCDSLYLSNIPDWIQNGDDAMRKMGQLKSAINRVIEGRTYVIHASEYFRENSGMPQRVYQGYPYDPAKSMSTDLPT
jgi:hypothetical protein